MEIKVNKYIVQMYEHGREDLARAIPTTATSEEEAIRKVLDDKFWYDEGTGYSSRKLTYPLTFKAKLNN